MILLEKENPSVLEGLRSMMEGGGSSGTIADFDQTIWRVSFRKDSERKKILVGIRINGFKDLECDEYLKKVYGDLMVEPADNTDVTLMVDMEKVVEEEKEGLIRKVAALKRNCFAPPFLKSFKESREWDENSVSGLQVLPYRNEESIYIQSNSDRVAVTFSIWFKEVDDVIGNVFCQEFDQGTKRNPTAPKFLYTKDPPKELQGLISAADNLGFATFVLFPRHYTVANQENSIDLLFTFRAYLHYHIKCSKAFLHMRMRAKTSEFLKVLNRAKPEKDF